MISYSVRQIFTRAEQEMLADATSLINYVRTTPGKTIRCHELARAVAMALRPHYRRHTIVVVDGHYGAVEHSWLLVSWRGQEMLRTRILDVYAVGRLPQVQLVDPQAPTLEPYRLGQQRGDVVDSMTLDLLGQMEPTLRKRRAAQKSNRQ